MAIEPKTPRKRAAKKASSKKSDAIESTDVAETKSATKKKSASIPVPMFQAAPVAEKAARPAKKADTSTAPTRLSPNWSKTRTMTNAMMGWIRLNIYE
jgi:hypothetical protein